MPLITGFRANFSITFDGLHSCYEHYRAHWKQFWPTFITLFCTFQLAPFAESPGDYFDN
jgi:hypothetical protein